MSHDLTIPQLARDGSEGLDEGDIAGALDDMALAESKEEVKAKPVERSYQQSEKLVRASAGTVMPRASEVVPSDAYMPIKALNQFSTDWVIKARVVKKADIRNWKNARGEGQLLNIDLVDREGTLI